MHRYVAEFVALMPDVIVSGDPPTVDAIKKEAPAIPIVMPSTTDLVALGLAESLARPGGSVTGFNNFEPPTAAKWLELLREIAPGVRRVAVLLDPQEGIGVPLYARPLEAAALSISVGLTLLPTHDAADTEEAINAFARVPDGGLIVPPSARVASRRAIIIRLGPATVYPRPMRSPISLGRAG